MIISSLARISYAGIGRTRLGSYLVSMRHQILFPSLHVSRPLDIRISTTHSEFHNKASLSTRQMKNGPVEMDDVVEDKGKLLPTASHLFKLILPVESLLRSSKNGLKNNIGHSHNTKSPEPLVFLLHPLQPLSYVSQLLIALIKPATLTITYRSISSSGRTYQWSDSTDIGDFIRDVARSSTFNIHFAIQPQGNELENSNQNIEEHTIVVEIPRFSDRTRFLRRRLERVTRDIGSMEALKLECDHEARRGARRMAMGGFGMLVVYWAAVARLTFWDYGWDIMEPITYLSGLSTVICGYLWFLYQGREVSYTSVLDRSISARRLALYRSRGFDLERWERLTNEANNLQRDILRIAEDYDENDEVKEDENIKIPQDLKIESKI